MNLRIASVATLLVLAMGCSSSPSAPTTTGTPVSIVSGSSDLTTTAYNPNPVSVAVGGTVTWMNNDNTAHTSTADNGSWNSGSISPGGSFSMTFPAAGTFTYHCTIHPGMIGTVNVH